MKKIAIAGAVALACAAGAAVAQEKLRLNSNEGVVFTPRYQAARTDGEGHCLLRVWVDRKPKYMLQLTEMQQRHAARQKALGLPVTADRNWIVVKPDEIQ